MGTYVIEGVELDYKVKMVLGDHQQPPRSQKLTIMERLREYRVGPCVLACNHVYHSCSIQNIHSIWLIMATVSSIQLLHASSIGTSPSSYCYALFPEDLDKNFTLTKFACRRSAGSGAARS